MNSTGVCHSHLFVLLPLSFRSLRSLLYEKTFFFQALLCTCLFQLSKKFADLSMDNFFLLEGSSSIMKSFNLLRIRLGHKKDDGCECPRETVKTCTIRHGNSQYKLNSLQTALTSPKGSKIVPLTARFPLDLLSSGQLYPWKTMTEEPRDGLQQNPLQSQTWPVLDQKEISGCILPNTLLFHLQRAIYFYIRPQSQLWRNHNMAML